MFKILITYVAIWPAGQRGKRAKKFFKKLCCFKCCLDLGRFIALGVFDYFYTLRS